MGCCALDNAIVKRLCGSTKDEDIYSEITASYRGQDGPSVVSSFNTPERLHQELDYRMTLMARKILCEKEPRKGDRNGPCAAVPFRGKLRCRPTGENTSQKMASIAWEKWEAGLYRSKDYLRKSILFTHCYWPK